jgi:hypothetical protein
MLSIGSFDAASHQVTTLGSWSSHQNADSNSQYLFLDQDLSDNMTVAPQSYNPSPQTKFSASFLSSSDIQQVPYPTNFDVAHTQPQINLSNQSNSQ